MDLASMPARPPATRFRSSLGRERILVSVGLSSLLDDILMLMWTDGWMDGSDARDMGAVSKLDASVCLPQRLSYLFQ